MRETVGEAATKKISKRRMDMIGCDINSHSKILNNPEHLRRIREYMDLASSIAMVNNAHKEAARESSSRKRKENLEQREAAKKAKAASEDEKRRHLMGGMEADIEKDI